MGSQNDVWLQKIKEFRGMYLGENPEVTDDFLLDSLEALCRENIVEYVKLQVLFALQEKVSSMVVDTTSVECAVGSLKDMFLHPSNNPSQLYLSQLLVTGSCLVISSDLLVKSSDTFVDFVGVLTDVIEKVNSPHNLLVRKAACECLWELELNYPGLLQSKLNHFYKHCEHESSPIFQNYMILFVTVLHHTIEHLASKAYAFYGLETHCLNKLLNDHSEPLKPLVLPSNVSGEAFPLALHSPPCGLPFSYLPDKVNSKELKRAISFLMENIWFLNTTSLFYVMLELMHCVKLAELSPITFKSQFIQWLPSTDICVFHMLLFLKLKFSVDMFREGDDLLLLQRLLLLATQPTLPSDLRLLCFQWLMHFPEELCKSGRAPTEPTAYTFIEDLQISNFYPTSFDNIDIIQDKLKLLCLYFWSNGIQETNALMDCLSLFNKQVLLGIGGKCVRALFRSLLWYYTYLHETSLAQEIYRLVMSVITTHPKFMPHVVDFLDAVAMVTPDSPFPVDLLRVLSQHVVSQPVSAVLPNLPHHLKLLAQTMRKSSINPSSTVQFLNQILHTSEISSEGSWSLGNGILAVCHSILLHQDTRPVVRDLGNLLLYMATTYQDIDIRDRARFYYSLLANVSHKKAAKILTSDTTLKQSLHVMADDITTTSFSTAPPVQHIKTPFLKLTRVPKDITEPKKAAEKTIESTLDLQPYGLLGHYCKMISDNAWNRDISIDYYVHYADPQILSTAPSRLYALVLQIDANKTYEPLQDIRIPSLSAANSSEPKTGCQRITIKFSAREPVPARFSVRAVFQNETGLTCTMVLDQLEIRFPDLFLPLCLPEFFQKDNTAKTKKRLFTDLWENVKDKQKTIDTPSNNGAMSVVCLSMEWKETQEILQKRFQPFIIDSNDNEVHVGIFLPPRQHLLLKFTTRNQNTVVTIATDDWRILGLVEKYLREIEQQYS